LDEHPSDGKVRAGKASFETLDAFSTYLHETLHWWQHIGSTTGLMLSFASPAKCHINHERLLKLLGKIGPQKSLRTFDALHPMGIAQEEGSLLNIVLNNWHDLEFNWRLLINPHSVHSVISSPYFDSVGHSLSIGLANTLCLVASTFDSEFSVVPDVRRWENGFAEVRQEKVEGFYFGSPIKLPPIGALHIFEGQARFSQIQYLYNATDGNLGWEHFRDRGMLDGVYVEAFKLFLSLTGISWPGSPRSSEVLLFLLICDLSINPSDGYPFNLHHFESFIISDTPGIRFLWFCNQVAKNRQLLTAISRCSKGGYQEVAGILCRTLVCATPIQISEELTRWSSAGPGFVTLLQQDATSTFSNENLPVRVCFAKHLQFAADRLTRPDYFCWPAMFMAGHGKFEIDFDESLSLFSKHQPLFISEIGGEIRPALFKDKRPEDIYQTFNDFYSWIVQYDFVDQWTVEDGEFDFDFSLLSPQYSPEVTKPWAEKQFKQIWNHSMNDFVLLRK
jgi:hypothetical protein